MKIKIGQRVIEARTKEKSTTPSGNAYYVVVYSLDGETLYQHHTGCMTAPPSPVGELETLKEVWEDCAMDDPRRTHTHGSGGSILHKRTVRALIEEALAQVAE